MTVELPPTLGRTLNDLVKSGIYASPAHAVPDGLRVLQQLLEGAEQIRAGRVAPFDEAAADRIKTQGRKLLAAENRPRRRSRGR